MPNYMCQVLLVPCEGVGAMEQYICISPPPPHTHVFRMCSDRRLRLGKVRMEHLALVRCNTATLCNKYDPQLEDTMIDKACAAYTLEKRRFWNTGPGTQATRRSGASNLLADPELVAASKVQFLNTCFFYKHQFFYAYKHQAGWDWFQK